MQLLLLEKDFSQLQPRQVALSQAGNSVDAAKTDTIAQGVKTRSNDN